MTRQKLIEMQPVIKAIIDDKHVQYYCDAHLNIHRRGWWKTSDNIGLLAPLEYYRIKNEDGSFLYFGKEIFENFDYDEFSKYSHLL